MVSVRRLIYLTDNRFVEAFNSKLWAEFLNAHWLVSLADVREKLEDWRRSYKEDRPHSGIGYNVTLGMHYPYGITTLHQDRSQKNPASSSPRTLRG